MSAAPAGALVISSEMCPWCEQPIPHDKFDEIQARIAAKERVRTATIEANLKQEFAVKAEALEVQTEARVAEALAAGAAAVKAAEAQVEAKAKAAAKEARLAAEAQAKVKLSEVESAKLKAEAQLADQAANQEQLVLARLQEQREILDEAHRKDRDADKAREFKERQKLTSRLETLQRQVEKKTADELGEGAEVDLYEELRAEFPKDEIKRVKRGEPGADIVHTVIEEGRTCGVIVYDSKNRAAWQNQYVTKLAKDRIAAKADHAVLATRVFPAGRSQLHHQDGVIVANPARVVALAQMLRKHMTLVSTLQLSDQGRDERKDALYQFMTSDRCHGLFDHIDSASEDLAELDVKEKNAHDLTWKKRGELIVSVQKSRNTLVAEVDKILTASVVAPAKS